MAKKLYEEADIQAIAEAIRAKNGTETTYKASEMAAAVEAIEAEAPMSKVTVTNSSAYTVKIYTADKTATLAKSNTGTYSVMTGQYMVIYSTTGIIAVSGSTALGSTATSNTYLHKPTSETSALTISTANVTIEPIG